jgi:F-type H+-transporting ATPase subunit delta
MTMDEQPKHQTALDSDDQQIGALYAKALLGAAGSNADEVVSQFEAVVRECLDRFPGLERSLASPKIGQDEKEAMLDRIFSGKIDKDLLNFFKILCRRGRVSSLRAIQVTASQLRDEELGRQRVQVTSSQPLTDAQKIDIAAQLKQSFGKEAVLEEKVDPSLLGGIVIRIGDRVYDGSISGKMQQMRHAVMAGVQRSIRQSFESLVSS